MAIMAYPEDAKPFTEQDRVDVEGTSMGTLLDGAGPSEMRDGDAARRQGDGDKGRSASGSHRI